MSELRETFIDELKDIYDAEKRLTKALPRMVKAAEHEDLKSAFEDHLKQTEDQIRRLERVFGMFDQAPKAKKCKAMEGLIEEAKELIQEEAGDAALICAAQKVEHYEIAAYGSLCSWANLLAEGDAAAVLGKTLAEEKQTDELLTELAESKVNVEENQEEELTTSRRGR